MIIVLYPELFGVFTAQKNKNKTETTWFVYLLYSVVSVKCFDFWNRFNFFFKHRPFEQINKAHRTFASFFHNFRFSLFLLMLRFAEKILSVDIFVSLALEMYID